MINDIKQITNMEQLELFQIEPIQPRAFERKNSALRKKPNRSRLKDANPLMEQLQPEMKKKAWRLSFSPKTQILVPCNWTHQQCLEYEKKYQGEDGKINHDSVSEHEIFGGMATRQ